MDDTILRDWINWACDVQPEKSQNQIAREIGVGHATVSRWRSGDRQELGPKLREPLYTYLAQLIAKVQRKPNYQMSPKRFVMGPPRSRSSSTED